MSAKGLYYYDINDNPLKHTSLINTVANNMDGYTTRQIRQAKLARETMKKLGFPSDEDYKWIVRTGIIKNCPVTVEDITTATDIFGPDLHSLKGKTTWRQPPAVQVEHVDVPQQIYDRNKDVVLVTDFMFIQGLPFLVTLSTNLNLIALEYSSKLESANIVKGTGKAIQIYVNKGMRVITAMTDLQFDPVWGLLGSTDQNLAAAHEHVLAIERKIRLIKEQFQALRSTLPFQTLPSRIIIEGVVFCVMMLNALPSKNGVSDYFSPREIMTRTKLDYNKHCKIPFGTFCQVFQDNNPSNTDAERK